MDGRLDIVASEEAEGVARVDGQAGVERFGPFPLARLVVLDLQRSDRLTEQESERAKIGVAVGPKSIALGQLLLLCLGKLAVLHVPQVILRLVFVLVQVDKVVFWKLERNGEEGMKRVKDLVVQRLPNS